MKKFNKKNKMQFSGYKNLLIATVIIVACVSLLSKLTEYTSHVEKISYTQFQKDAQEGIIKKLYVSGAEAEGIKKDGSHFAVRIPERYDWKSFSEQSDIDVAFVPPSTDLSLWHFLPMFSIILALLVAWYFLKQSRGGSGSGSGGPGGIFSMGKSRAKMFLPSTIKQKFSDVAGATDAKEELQNIIDYLKNPEKFRHLGAKISRGVLLVGEPGNGKTLLARAVAGEANVPFFSITGSDFIEVFVGVGAARVRDLFAQARKHSPCIIFIDEIDAIGRARGTGMGGGHDEREQTLNQLLTEMDGFGSDGSNIIVLAATNMPEVLDKALLRPGRFDCRIDVPYPDEQAREDILHIHARKVKLAPDVDLKSFAADTAGFSGAELADLINKAAVEAARLNQLTITTEDLKKAQKTIVNSQEAVNPQQNPLAADNSLARMHKPSQIKTTFASVAGMENAKEELKDIVDHLKDPKKFGRLGARISKGVLLVGPPGNGKTLLARAVAGEANCPFFSISGSEFVQKYVGVGAARVRDMFAQARKHKPSIIFIDEIDAVGAKRINSDSGGGQEHNQTLNQLLTEMDGFDSKEDPIIIIAATNRADILDKALLRPGRFDRQVQVPNPRVADRLKILQLHAKDFHLDESVDLERIARGTPDFSGAQLAHLINEAALLATKHPEKDAIFMEDFEEARDKIIAGKKWKDQTKNKEDLAVTAYHEAGHALMHVLQPEFSMPLHKVTILARGGALGLTWGLPEGDQLKQTKEQMIAHIKVCMGGRAAEELVFEKQSTGAHGDFQQATEAAQKMVRYYGMTDELGPVIYDERSFPISQKTAERIDDAVKKISQECLAQVKDTLIKNRGKLEKLAQALLEKETLEAQEVYELLGVTPRTSHKLA
ncbi:MAG: ATP-dependent zinc metalloprotease FtsH [Candidatus Dependentiae bacterium]